MVQRRSFLKKSLLTVAGSAFISFGKPINEWRDPASKKARFRFIIASDGHFGEPDTPFELYYSNLMNRLKTEKEKNGLDLCIFNGDLTHDNPVLLPSVKKYFDELQIPYIPVKGNHDMVDNEAWESIWGIPENHDLKIEDVVFLVGSTSNKKGEYLCADLRWLRKTLEKHENEKYIFLILHISQGNWTTFGVNCPDVMKLLEKYPQITAIFHGHDHDQDDVKTTENHYFFFDGHFGGSWGTDYHGYRVVEILETGDVLTYQYNPEVNPVVNKNLI